MTQGGLHRYRAERLLRKDFGGLRSKVLAIVRSQLRSKGIALDPADLEACYAEAWHGLYATVLGGEQVENPSAWLVLVTFRRAIDESRSASRLGHVGGAHPVASLAPDLLDEWQGAVPDHDVARELDDRTRLRQVFEGLRSRLSPRECEAASLCYLQGLSRAEAAERMGISESRMRKLMEGSGAGRPGVASKVGELLDTIKAGGWCEQQSSLMRAYAFGVLDPGGERHMLAMAHCRECPACRAHVASLRGLAAVLPLPLLSPLALAGGAGVAAGTGSVGSRTSATGAARRAATGVAKTGIRVRSSFTGTGWSGFAGSLTAKLAVTALVALSAGYALLGSRAHGSPHAIRRVVAPGPVAGETRSPALYPRSPGRARSNHQSRRSQATATRSSPKRSSSEASSSEFLPERSRDGAVVVPPATTPARSRNSSRASREFRIE